MSHKRGVSAWAYLQFVAGVFIMSLGIALCTRADLGTTPISALPYVASLGFTPSMGVFTIVFNLLLILIQVALMGRNFPKIQWLQLPAATLMGIFIDFWTPLVPDCGGAGYMFQLLYLGLGTLTLAFGIFAEVSANVVVMSGEGVVLALAVLTHKDFGALKVIFDSTLVGLSVLLSFGLFHELRGVREGTVISAVAVGFTVRCFFAAHRRLRKR